MLVGQNKTAKKTKDQASEIDAAELELILENAKAKHREGLLQESLSMLDSISELIEMSSDENKIAFLLLRGVVERDKGKANLAEDYFAAALQLARETTNIVAQVDALNLQASVFSSQGEDALAIQHLKECLDIVAQLDEPEKELNLHCNIGALYLNLSDHAESLTHLKRAFEIGKALPQRTNGEGITLVRLGQLYQSMGDNTMAKRYNSQAKEFGRELNNKLLQIASLNNLAELSFLESDLPNARKQFRDALMLAYEADFKKLIIDNLIGLSRVDHVEKQLDKMFLNLQQALNFAKEIQDKAAQTDVIMYLGHWHLARNEHHEAVKQLHLALEFAKELQHPKLRYEAHKLLSGCYETLGDTVTALHHYKQYHEVKELIYNEDNDKRTRQLSIQFDVERSRHEAREHKLRTELAQQARHEAEAIAQERTRELEKAHVEIVTRLAVAAEFRDDDTGEHTKRVGRNAALLARAIGWQEEDVKLLYVAARLHDVGKIGISDTILLKPGKLTDEEFDIIKTHTSIGREILAGGESRLLQLAEQIALYHHERWDGNGYPFGLSGEAIPQAARIVSVADVMDALAHERPYKQAWPMSQVITEIGGQSGQQFDPEVVNAFKKVFVQGSPVSYEELSLDWENVVFKLSTLKTHL